MLSKKNHMNEKASRYILYARKSSESEDRQMASIDSQVQELKKLAEENGLNVIEVLEESCSAKEPGRPIFNALMAKIRAGEADGILCWKLNRLARNPVDGGLVSWDLQGGKIKHIMTYGRSYYPDDNVLMMAVELGMANQFIKDLSIDAKRGLRAKAERGWFPGKAPLGYLHHPLKSKGEKEVICDPDRFEVVKKAFQSIASGESTVPEAYRTAVQKYGLTNRVGGRLSLSNWYAMVNNPFYYGEFEFPRGSEKWYKGKHQAMISETEFYRIQEILGKKGTTRPKKHSFAYRGFLECGNCGAMITAENKAKHQKNGNVHCYTYYHCTKRRDPHCPEKCVEAKELEIQIILELESIDIPSSFREWAERYLEQYASEELDTIGKLRMSQEKQHSLIETKLDELLNMRLEGKISDEDYATKREKLLEEKKELKKALALPPKKTWVEEFRESLNIAEDVRETFENGDEAKQKQVLASLGSNLTILDKKFAIKGKNPILRLKKISPVVKEISARFEPPGMAETKEKLELAYSSSPILLRRQDSNLRPGD